MADPNAPNPVHTWIADTWLPGRLGKAFLRQRVRLTAGGSYTFPCVSEDAQTVGTVIITTAGGKNSATKLYKVRSDFYFLLLARAEKRLAIFTDRAMYKLVSDELKEGRVPKEIELMFVDKLPPEVLASLQQTPAEASNQA
jgi:hypothetical protein